MKARIKKTGEVLRVADVTKDFVYLVSPQGGDHLCLLAENVELLNGEEQLKTSHIDWEQRRYEIAKDVLASSFATPMKGTSIFSYVRSCVQVADILIEELKGGEQ